MVRAAATTLVSEPPMQTRVMEVSDKAQGFQMPKLSVK